MSSKLPVACNTLIAPSFRERFSFENPPRKSRTYHGGEHLLSKALRDEMGVEFLGGSAVNRPVKNWRSLKTTFAAFHWYILCMLYATLRSNDRGFRRTRPQVMSFPLVVCIIQRGSWLILPTWHFSAVIPLSTHGSRRETSSISRRSALTGRITSITNTKLEMPRRLPARTIANANSLNSISRIPFHLFGNADVSRNNKIFMWTLVRSISMTHS